MICPDCGLENSPSARSCAGCGKPLTPSRKPGENVPFSIPENCKPVNFLFVVLPLVVAVVFGITGGVLSIEFWESFMFYNTSEIVGFSLVCVAAASAGLGTPGESAMAYSSETASAS